MTDYLMNWLKTDPCDVLLLQETHHGLGRESSRWTTAGWHVITSVCPSKRHQGLAVFIKESLVDSADIKFQEPAVGRLLHVRFPLSPRDVDVDLFNFYRHAWGVETGGALLEQRLKLWTTLGRHLDGLPRRNILAVAGDFNSTLIPESGITGCGHLHHLHPPRLPCAQ